MILVGNQRGGAKDLAIHLMKEENERVEVHELRGFMSENLMGALNESYAVSRGTKCKQFLYSLSLNPPKNEQASVEDFEVAIEQAEKRLNLSGQPRAIVFHEKEGRRHAHAVWSRINVEEMKAVQMSYDHEKLKTLSREIFLEHGWKMPPGLVNSEDRDPRNFTLAEWQQAKRAGKDAKVVKADFQDAWAISDSKAAFTHALQERGYKLARGDRRGFVAVDCQGEVYPVSRWTGVKTKEVGKRLGDLEELPGVDETKDLIAKEMLPKMQGFEQEVSATHSQKKAEAEEQREKLSREQREKREALDKQLAERCQQEEQMQQARLRRGLFGLLDRVTGKRKKTIDQNEQETQESLVRDREEKDSLIQRQISEKRDLKETHRQEQKQLVQQKQDLQEDARHFEQMKIEPDDKKAFLEKRRAQAETRHTRIRGPTRER